MGGFQWNWIHQAAPLFYRAQARSAVLDSLLFWFHFSLNHLSHLEMQEMRDVTVRMWQKESLSRLTWKTNKYSKVQVCYVQSELFWNIIIFRFVFWTWNVKVRYYVVHFVFIPDILPVWNFKPNLQIKLCGLIQFMFTLFFGQ